jgi:hypothetical protein
MTYEEQERMISYFVGHWDDGALRTVHVHFGECNEWAEQFFYKFYCKYFDETACCWKCRNPSACCVSLAREFSYYLEQLD